MFGLWTDKRVVNVGQDALLVENMHDVPWLRAEYPSPETTASLAVLCAALRSTHPAMPIGLQILSARNRDALAVAAAAGNVDLELGLLSLINAKQRAFIMRFYVIYGVFKTI